MAQVTKEQNRWLLSGDMTIQHLDALLAEKAAIGQSSPLEIDLGAVTDVDTASISLLLEWLRHANAQHVPLSFSNLPSSLMSLATLYGVLDVIPQTAH